MRHKLIITTVLIVTFILLTHLAFGQPFDPPDGGGSGGGTPVGAPIDGGISILIAAGAALIGRKYFKNKKNNPEN